MTVVLGHYPVVLLLVLFRVAGILFALPFFGISSGGGWLLAGVSFPLALLFCSTLSPEWVSAAHLLSTPAMLAFAIMGEALLGLAIGTVCGIFIGACNVAGMIASRGTSLGMAEELDPITRESSSILVSFWRPLFLMILLGSGAHLVIIRIIARTFHELPVPWTGWINSGYDMAMLGAVAFRAGVTIALPVLLISLLVTIGMALMGRMASEFNVLFLSLPFRLTLGLLTMAISVLYCGDFFASMAQRMLTTLVRYLGW